MKASDGTRAFSRNFLAVGRDIENWGQGHSEQSYSAAAVFDRGGAASGHAGGGERLIAARS
jgi:hypothetical protein